MFLGRNTISFSPVAICRVWCRDFWISQSLWVRMIEFGQLNFYMKLITRHSDFFPVIFGFLRRLPIIGAILSHPAVSRVKILNYDTKPYCFNTNYSNKLRSYSLHHAKVEHAFNA
jgi:hypothetical protein